MVWRGFGVTVPSVVFYETFLFNDQSQRVRSKDTRRKVPTFNHHIPWELILPKQYVRIVLCFLLAYQKPNLLIFLLFISFTNMLYYVLLFSSFLNSSRYTFYRIHNSRKKISKPNQLFDWLEDKDKLFRFLFIAASFSLTDAIGKKYEASLIFNVIEVSTLQKLFHRVKKAKKQSLHSIHVTFL